MIHLEIDTRRCKGCGLCVHACPRQVLATDPHTLNAKGFAPAMVQDIARCIGCGNCYLFCPDCAITLAPLPQKARSAKSRIKGEMALDRQEE